MRSVLTLHGLRKGTANYVAFTGLGDSWQAPYFAWCGLQSRSVIPKLSSDQYRSTPAAVIPAAITNIGSCRAASMSAPMLTAQQIIPRLAANWHNPVAVVLMVVGKISAQYRPPTVQISSSRIPTKKTTATATTGLLVCVSTRSRRPVPKKPTWMSGTREYLSMRQRSGPPSMSCNAQSILPHGLAIIAGPAATFMWTPLKYSMSQ
mmetsp:Transcript_26183/g.49182  ORF Transcript_26183/g.49182 Transcript_26183/m.49182 type:complete len:206 (+) Transcript_26183:61-678(+)